MREIKFRAWHKNKEKMLEVMSISFTLRTMWVKPFGDEEGHINEELVLFDDVVLMQYTGLKDKNGAEIYEGDITKLTYISDGFGITGEIVFEGGSYCMRVFVGGKMRLIVLSLDAVRDDDLEIEKLGDIYENPELLGDVNE